jgi:hypothetical protein
MRVHRMAGRDEAAKGIIAQASPELWSTMQIV